MSGPYDLVVLFKAEELPSLASKKLYISRKVNERYTVIWSSSNIEAINKFSWNDTFEVFSMDRFTNGEKVAPNGTKEIWKGWFLTFNKDGSTVVDEDANPKMRDLILIRKNIVPIWSGLSSALYTGIMHAPSTTPPSKLPKEAEPSKPPVSSTPAPPEKMTGIPLNLSPTPKDGLAAATASVTSQMATTSISSPVMQSTKIGLSTDKLKTALDLSPDKIALKVEHPQGSLNIELKPDQKPAPGVTAVSTTTTTATTSKATSDPSTSATSSSASATESVKLPTEKVDTTTGGAETDKEKDLDAEKNTAKDTNLEKADAKDKDAKTDKKVDQEVAATETGDKNLGSVDKDSDADKAKAKDKDAKKDEKVAPEAAVTETGDKPLGSVDKDSDADKAKAKDKDTESTGTKDSDADKAKAKDSEKVEGNVPDAEKSKAKDSDADKAKVKDPNAGEAKPTDPEVSTPVTPPPPTATPFFLGRFGTMVGANSTLVPSSKVMVWIADAPATDKAGETFTKASFVAEADASAGLASLVNVEGAWFKGDLQQMVALKKLDWEDGKFVPHKDVKESDSEDASVST